MIESNQTIDPGTISSQEFYRYLISTVVPRPIAFASTISKQGQINLSPFSYFNSFSSNPPILIFSPARRGRDNTTKDTLNNLREVGEVVINLIDYAIVHQMSLASGEYPAGVNEFEKAGLRAIASEKVKPPRVGESPVSFECRVNDIVPLGNGGGAGNLVICEILLAHMAARIFDENGSVDPQRLDAVARMGGNYYCRASGDAVFQVPKPIHTLGMGIDRLPESLRNSRILSGRALAHLASYESVPQKKPLDEKIVNLMETVNLEDTDAVHKMIATLIDNNRTEEAWQCLLHYHL